MKAIILVAPIMVFMLASSASAQEARYQPTWESLDKRPTPPWFDDAKFGIFIHWGVYAVPAWSPKGTYSEWYWYWLETEKSQKKYEKEREGVRQFHARIYGEKFNYQDFAPMFKAELFNPDQWAEIFAKSGARYVVHTSKHHEGFCLWPSPHSWNWNSVDIGPHRDLCGDLTKAVKARGLKMGFYYSLYEWFNPLYLSDPKRYVDEHMLPQLKDLVTRYEPSIVWSDGEWDHPSEVWRSTEFLAWLFNESSVRDEVVVNDRWGKGTRGKHGDFHTTEYGHGGTDKQHKWEEDRGMGASFGYNRNEDAEDYKTAAELIHLLTDTVSTGGNLLLDIGPTADGRIPVIMQERLLEIGDWLKVNGEAIYGTHSWRETSGGESVRYTAGDDAVYAICLRWPGKELVLSAPKSCKDTTVTMLGLTEPLKWKSADGKLSIEVPPLSVDEVPCRHAYVFKLTGVK